MRRFRAFLQATGRVGAEETGQTMPEYGLILSLISVALILALTTIGSTIAGFFTSFTAAL